MDDQNPDTQTSVKLADEPEDIWYFWVWKDKICCQMLKSEAGARWAAVRDIHNLLLPNSVSVNHFLQPFFYVLWETFTSFMFASRDKSHLQLKDPVRTSTSLDLFFI